MTKNYTLNDTQKQLVNKFYFLAETVVCSLNHVREGYVTENYLHEDAVQDALYALCVAACKFNPDNIKKSSFSTFAQIVIRNYLFMKLREMKRNCHYVSFDCQDNELVIPDYCIEDDICNKVIFEMVCQFIPDRQNDTKEAVRESYDIFLQYYFNGVCMDALAEKYNISVSMAYRKKNMALKEIKEKLCDAALVKRS